MIGIIGGTGPEGIGLAMRFAVAGEAVCIGSRDGRRALEAAERVRSVAKGAMIEGRVNEAAAEAAEVVIVAVPYRALGGTLPGLEEVAAGKLVISVVASIEFVDGRPTPIVVSAGSAAQEIADALPRARVASGFQTLSAEKLAHVDTPLHEDTIICADEREDRQAVMALAQRIEGLRAISGGRLANSCYPEQFVGMLAALNRIHKKHTGLKIADL